MFNTPSHGGEEMLQVQEAKQGENSSDWELNICNDLFKEWLNDLSQEEKEVWLWNALLDMAKIKQRRNS